MIKNKLSFSVISFALLIGLISCGGGSTTYKIKTDDVNDDVKETLDDNFSITLNGNNSSVFYKGRNIINAVSINGLSGSDEDDLEFSIEFPNDDNDNIINIVDINMGLIKINPSINDIGKEIEFILKVKNNDRIDSSTGLPEEDKQEMKLIISDNINTGNYSYQLYNNEVSVDLDFSGYKSFEVNDIMNYMLPINYRVNLAREDIDDACKKLLETGKFSITENTDNSYSCFYFKPVENPEFGQRYFVGEILSLYFYKNKIENTVIYYDVNSNNIIYKSLLEDYYSIPEYYKEADPSIGVKSIYEKNGIIELKNISLNKSKKINTVLTNQGALFADNKLYIINTMDNSFKDLELNTAENSELKWINQNNTSDGFFILEKNESYNKIWFINKELKSNVIYENIGEILDDSIIVSNKNIISINYNGSYNYISLNGNNISENIIFYNNNGIIHNNYNDVLIPIKTNNEEKLYFINDNKLIDKYEISSISNNVVKNEFIVDLNGGSIQTISVHNDNMSFGEINYNKGNYLYNGNNLLMTLSENLNNKHNEIFNINNKNNLSQFLQSKIDENENIDLNSIILTVNDINYQDFLIKSINDNGVNKTVSEKSTINGLVNKLETIYNKNKNVISTSGDYVYHVCFDESGYNESNSLINQQITDYSELSLISNYIMYISNDEVFIFDNINSNCI